MTWTFPATLVPGAPDELPRDPTGRDHFLVALWGKEQKTPVPLIVVRWDTKATPASLSPSATAQRYLQSLKPGTGFKLSKPTEVQIGGRTAWQMNYSRPDDAGQTFDSAIAMPLKDRTLLFIQISARSERELDGFVHSLVGATFDQQQ